MSLSQQVASLAKCAFIMFALFRIDGASFMASQLYYDVQATIKNTIFCIANMKLLDPTLPFYMLQLSDDHLEGLFGVYRTQSSNHNPGIIGIAERCSAAQEVNLILTEYPGYDRKPYRLALEGASGVNHLNPGSWEGNVCVSHVVLRASWAEGRTQAEQALRRASVVPNFNYDDLCNRAGGLQVDLMRPFGHYMGVTDPGLDNLDDTILRTSLPGAAVLGIAKMTHS